MISCKLAEAILTEPTAQAIDDSGSIRLADTRTQRRPSGEQERDMFLPGNDSDDEGDEETLIEERRRVLSNSGAQLSRINLQGSNTDEDDYEIVRGPGQYSGRSGVGRNSGGTLSGKAGVILV